ncbi:WD40-repeat-containing domain protein [Melanogaster broomeanus]|nr:WD40-repeat-containing domain protein [Melanogaster broomeanus]
MSSPVASNSSVVGLSDIPPSPFKLRPSRFLGPRRPLAAERATPSTASIIASGHPDWAPQRRQILDPNQHTPESLQNLKSTNLIVDPTSSRGTITSVAFYPDDRRLLSGSTDGSLRVWDVESQELLQEFAEPDVLSCQIESVAVSLDGTKVASGSKDGTLDLRNATTLQLLFPLLMGGTGFQQISCVTFSPDSRTLAGQQWFRIKLWDTDWCHAKTDADT